MTTANPFRVRFDVGTNFDPTLIDIIDECNTDRSFLGVFGKLKSDMFGGGRPSVTSPTISFEQVAAHVSHCHQRNLTFNYLLNPACIGNKEVVPDDHHDMMRFIEQVIEIGVDAVTVNSPLLCSIIKQRFPKIHVTIGLYAAIFTPKQVVEWKRLGADELTLGHCFNRDFPMLEAAIRLGKELDIGLRLIANNICLRDCSYKRAHGTALSHASQTSDSSSQFFVDYNVMQCTYDKFTDPVRLLAAEWIRPEDLHYYEQFTEKVGFERLSIKLLDRVMTTEFIGRVVRAYTARRYSGNLLDIMSLPITSNLQDKGSAQKRIELAKLMKFNGAAVGGIPGVFSLPGFRLDNDKLDGFLEPFTKGFSCVNKVCKGSCSLTGSGSCSYCKNWADKVVSFDPAEVSRWKQHVERVLQSIKSSEMFQAPKRAAPAVE